MNDEFLRVFTPSDLEDAVEKAVVKEREECAKLAENWGGAPPSPLGRRAALAKAIRDRGKK